MHEHFISMDVCGDSTSTHIYIFLPMYMEWEIHGFNSRLLYIYNKCTILHVATGWLAFLLTARDYHGYTNHLCGRFV